MEGAICVAIFYLTRLTICGCVATSADLTCPFSLRRVSFSGPHRTSEQFETGAIGTFTLALTLLGYKYSCELDVLCDGYQLKLIDPYNAPELRVRTPNGDDEQVYRVRHIREWQHARESAPD